ncbi:glycoside-pentoside-hexuronide (GPH):cation symporter [Curtobacterium sp. S6]|uniref:glycoside-pentoside-hexuronide (GPH):cation symporter n=1 Tax=Curtobacterium sp. S6 TaxID=1479623 RepID=UPI000AD35DA6|nr:glycoside-pentoside-hexuronide (GPH):cation symporter [Curtobacterium sp. S6]
MSELATSSIPHVAQEQLPRRRIIGYGFGDAGCNIAFQMTSLFLLIFYTNVVGISTAHAGLVFLFVKFWDAFADLFAGRMVDRTMTRWGKFRPFLLWYSVPLLLSNLLCFWIPVSDYGWKIVWAVTSYALMGLLYSLVNIPYGSLAGAMSQNPVDRSRLAAARMVGSGATILLLAVFLSPRIKQAGDLSTTFLVTAVVFTVVGAGLFATTFLTSKEIVYREVERVSLRETVSTMKRNGPLLRLCLSSVLYLTGQSAVGAMTIYIATDVLSEYSTGGWVAAIGTVLTTGAVLYVGPFGPAVTRAFGKKWGFVYSCAFAFLGGLIFILGAAVMHHLWISLLGMLMVGIGMAVLNTMTWALEADTVEYGEYKTGIRTEGATYAAFSFTRKVGQALGGAIASWSLGIVGYAEGASSQVDQVRSGMSIAYGIVPGVIFLLAMLVMLGYPLTEQKFREIMKSIEANRRLRHEDLHTGAVPTAVATGAERQGPSASESHPTTNATPAVPGDDQARIRIISEESDPPAPEADGPSSAGGPHDSRN